MILFIFLYVFLEGGNHFFFLTWNQTGLSGSSAIVCAALSCLLDFYKVRHLIKVEVRPNLILNAEKELGIVAGLQDRVAQVYGGLVYMVSTENDVSISYAENYLYLFLDVIFFFLFLLRILTRSTWKILGMANIHLWILIFFPHSILSMLRTPVIPERCLDVPLLFSISTKHLLTKDLLNAGSQYSSPEVVKW